TPKYGAITLNASINTSAGKGMLFTPREPTDLVDMQVQITNARPTPPGTDFDTFDVTIIYGTRVETFRGVTVNSATTRAADLPHARINKDPSSLVTVTDLASGTTDYGTGFPPPPTTTFPIKAPVSKPTGFSTNFRASDFIDVFQANTSLDKVPIFNILLTPGIFDNLVNSAALAFAERKRAFVILDPPIDAAADSSTALKPIDDDTILPLVLLSENGALYFPYLRSTHPLTGDAIDVAPSGYVAGIYARTDTRRGVWKAPAGIASTLVHTIGVVARGTMSNERQGVLYGVLTGKTPINCLRSFPGAGTVVFGARTLVGSNQAFNQSKYVPVRRMTLFIEQTLLANLTWVV